MIISIDVENHLTKSNTLSRFKKKKTQETRNRKELLFMDSEYLKGKQTNKKNNSNGHS